MENMKFYTTLDTTPAFGKDKTFNYVFKGATFEIKYSLANKSYDFSNIQQFTVIFKQNTNLLPYNLYVDSDLNGELEQDSHFKYDDETKTIIFTLLSDETNAFKAGMVLNEITVETEVDGNTTVSIEPQPSLAIIDSLYSQAGIINNN